jgi:hypothetical protein
MNLEFGTGGSCILKIWSFKYKRLLYSVLERKFRNAIIHLKIEIRIYSEKNGKKINGCNTC